MTSRKPLYGAAIAIIILALYVFAHLNRTDRDSAADECVLKALTGPEVPDASPADLVRAVDGCRQRN